MLVLLKLENWCSIIIYSLCYCILVPGEFLIDPYTKTLGDPSRRPEILNSTIEYIASQDYMVCVFNDLTILVNKLM